MAIQEFVEFVDGSESRSVCEDAASVVVGEGEGYAWVLDGSSGRGGSVTGGESDGKWYVECLGRELDSRVLDWGSSLSGVVEESIAAVAMELDREVSGGGGVSLACKREDMPRATVALVRWSEGRDVLEYFNLADAVTVVRASDGVRSVSSAGVLEELEEQTRRLVAREKELGHKAPYRAESVQRQIRETRPVYSNVPSGYWVAQLNPIAARFGESGEYSLTDVEAVFLCSDGFSGSVERYGLFGSWGEALDSVGDSGVEEVVARIRERERDGGLETSPEAKQHDDVGVCYLEFGSE